MIYLIATIVLTALILLYFRIADHFNIIDKPNERSSHTSVTIRGGGVIFPLAAVFWFVWEGWQYPYFMAGLILISVISLADDILTLKALPRFLVHLLAVTAMLYNSAVASMDWYYVLIGVILVIGWINAFNFMDGINGITAFYALVAILSFLWVNNEIHIYSTSLLGVITISLLIFSFFNVRKKARTFAGDVGSVSLAFILAFLMIQLILYTEHIEFILFFAVYGIDSALTILRRLSLGQNIFRAHRSHLYQFMANEMQMGHIKVSAIYAISQSIINTLIILNFINGWLPSGTFLAAGLLIMVLIYVGARGYIIRQISLQSS
ncbi:MAG: UDP-GlcNAc--UDP-phosphate GlcNAc-1-phosphate transferase [Owenweeksia sp.]